VRVDDGYRIVFRLKTEVAGSVLRLSSWKISATIIPDVKIFKLLKPLKKELYQILQETYIMVNQVLSKKGEEGISAEYWIDLQTDYDLANARRELEVA